VHQIPSGKTLGDILDEVCVKLWDEKDSARVDAFKKKVSRGLVMSPATSAAPVQNERADGTVCVCFLIPKIIYMIPA
jgi:hypothetical protein